jgi:hypothetical protein
VIADLGARQGVGNFGFDPLAALRAPIAVNRVLGNDGVDVFGNVLDDAGPRFLTGSHLTLADGATFQAKDHLLMNNQGFGPATAWMSLFLTRLLAPSGSGLFFEDGSHPRRRGRGIPWLALPLGQHFGQLQQRKHHRLGALFVNGLGFLGREIRPQSYFQSCNSSGFLAMRDGKKYPKTKNLDSSAAYG